MKFYAYNVRPDEAPFLTRWSEEHQIEVATTSEFLTVDTINQAAGYDGISALQTIPYPAELFRAINQLGIRYLALRNVGVDNLDLQAAVDNHVAISNVPAYSPYAIAEFAVLQAMNLLRRTKAIEQQQQAGGFHWSPDFMGSEMRKQTVGVIGTGRIGRQAIKLYEGLGAKVIAYDPSSHTEDPAVTYVADFTELLKQADVVTLHAPGRESNYHMIGADAFKQMKSSAILVNTARGSLVDLDALISALDNHEIAGAALDAFEHETASMQQFDTQEPFDDPVMVDLAARDNVLISPHMAFHTDVAVTNMVNGSLNSLLQFNKENHSEFQVE